MFGIEDLEEWREKLTEWAESLMLVLWGTSPRTAPRVNALQGWMEESPV
jgi:hypothetical protein